MTIRGVSWPFSSACRNPGQGGVSFCFPSGNVRAIYLSSWIPAGPPTVGAKSVWHGGLLPKNSLFNFPPPRSGVFSSSDWASRSDRSPARRTFISPPCRRCWPAASGPADSSWRSPGDWVSPTTWRSRNTRIGPGWPRSLPHASRTHAPNRRRGGREGPAPAECVDLRETMEQWKAERSLPRFPCDVPATVDLESDSEGNSRHPLHGRAFAHALAEDRSDRCMGPADRPRAPGLPARGSLRPTRARAGALPRQPLPPGARGSPAPTGPAPPRAARSPRGEAPELRGPDQVLHVRRGRGQVIPRSPLQRPERHRDEGSGGARGLRPIRRGPRAPQ